ncbi:MAG: hypothetical protein KAS53_12010 [Candidatus Cloacimonetes bacterium]|nr:hypothetical protein [Candidatus Cloacimonadota bacterium]
MKRIEIILFIICNFFLWILIIFKILTSIAITDFTNIEFPLYIINNIAQDDKGDIYVGLDSWSRIQVYNRSGKFKYGWLIKNNGSGGWSFKIDDNNVIHSFGSLLYQQYSKNGELLLTKDVNPEFHNTYKELGTRRKLNNCEDFKISKKWLLNYTIIEKETEEILIETPFYLTLVDLPIPMIFYIIFFMYYVVRKILYDYKNKNKLIKKLKP